MSKSGCQIIAPTSWRLALWPFCPDIGQVFSSTAFEYVFRLEGRVKAGCVDDAIYLDRMVCRGNDTFPGNLLDTIRDERYMGVVNAANTSEEVQTQP